MIRRTSIAAAFAILFVFTLVSPAWAGGNGLHNYPKCNTTTTTTVPEVTTTVPEVTTTTVPEVTTTTAPESTTSTTEVTTTTGPVDSTTTTGVVTTTSGPDSTTTTGPVDSTTTTGPADSTTTSPPGGFGRLPHTGSGTGWLAALGALFVGAGALALWFRPRRHA